MKFLPIILIAFSGLSVVVADDFYSQVLNATEQDRSRVLPQLLPELLSRIPVDKIHDFGARALNLGRTWPGFSEFAKGVTPSASIGIVSLGLFIICIWIIIYSIGVTPVAGFLGREGEAFDPYEGIPDMFNTMEQPYPYRGKRSLNHATNLVLNAIDKLTEEQTTSL